MRVKFVYKAGRAVNGVMQPGECKIVNADTDEPIELVQGVSFSVRAQDMLPHLLIEVIPSVVEIECEANTRRRFTFDEPTIEDLDNHPLLGPGRVA